MALSRQVLRKANQPSPSVPAPVSQPGTATDQKSLTATILAHGATSARPPPREADLPLWTRRAPPRSEHPGTHGRAAPHMLSVRRMSTPGPSAARRWGWHSAPLIAAGQLPP